MASKSKYPQGGSVDSLTKGVRPVAGTAIKPDALVGQMASGSAVINSQPTNKARSRRK